MSGLTSFTTSTYSGTSQDISSIFAPLSSPSLTGTPISTTASQGTNTTQIATTAFVQSAIHNYSYNANSNNTQCPNPSYNSNGPILLTNTTYPIIIPANTTLYNQLYIITYELKINSTQTGASGILAYSSFLTNFISGTILNALNNSGPLNLGGFNSGDYLEYDINRPCWFGSQTYMLNVIPATNTYTLYHRYGISTNQPNNTSLSSFISIVRII